VIEWIFSSLLTIAFFAIVVASILQIVTTCRQWRQLARRYPLGPRTTPDRQTRVWRAYVGSLFHPFQHLRLAWDERGIFLIPTPLTRMIGFGPLYLPRQDIEVRLVRTWGADYVELVPKDTSCALLLISKRAWRKSGQPLP
jgi:hypothetical protein